MIDGRDLDRQVELELERVLGPIEQGSIPAWRIPAHPRFARTATVVKAMTGLAVVVLVGVGATAAGAAVVTGSMNPSDWGQQAAACRDSLNASGMNGFGACVENASGRRPLPGSSNHPAKQSPTSHGGAQSGERDKPSTPSPLTAPPGGPSYEGPPLITPGPGPGASH